MEQEYPLSAQAQLSDSLLQTRQSVPGFEKLVRIGRRDAVLIEHIVPLTGSASGEPRAVAKKVRRDRSQIGFWPVYFIPTMLTNSCKPGERFLNQVGGIVSTRATNEEPEQTRRMISIQSIKANSLSRQWPILGRERILFAQEIRQRDLTGVRHLHRISGHA